MRHVAVALALALIVAGPPDARAQAHDSAVVLRHDSVSVHLVDADVRAAVEALAPYLDKPVGFGSTVPGARVTLETPTPVARDAVRGLLEGILSSQNLELVRDSAMYRVQVKAPPAVPPPPTVAPNGRTGAPGEVQLFIIHLRHARAADVAATVNALFGRASSLGDIGSTRPATLDQQLQAGQMQPAASPITTPGPNAPVSSSVPAAHNASFSGDVTIVPDPRSNSLFIRASQNDFDLITSAVRELDTRPLQVLIEVIIAEVERTNSLQFGVDATLPPTKVNGGSTVINGSQTGAGLTDFVLHAMNFTGLNIDATLTAAAERGDVRILSKPILIAANNQAATINVGSQRPFVQLSRTLPTDNASVDQVVQYKDVGTKLTVLPTISPDGYVGLEVTQEIDNATQEVAFDAPVISTRSIQTELLIKDGQTVALGGFTDDERDVTQGGIPFLSSIPLLGGLFGHSSHQTTATEIYLFLTPHVIRTDEDADSVTHPILERANKVKP
ncbi:MAG TPA: secretin N-terminal domain-containing protein [Gemmatimonadaceae bacterium]|nr:secretin N-terminal domain-containing protein [Gemmatimonadaceae bacterium]HSC31447.1 secretin N-terminal domain-containing protein [Gemmatimonadaceae bacterium]